MMQAVFRAATRSRARAVPGKSGQVFGSSRRPQLLRTLITKKYTADHEAVVYDDATGIATVYITDYAQKSLGDVVFVELKAAGENVRQGDALGAVESVKAASDIYAPVSGVVEEVNAALDSQPGLLNKSAEDQGWLCKIKVQEVTELDDLLSADAYRETCA